MDNSIYNIQLDTQKTYNQTTIHVRKGDSNRELRVRLVENGKPFSAEGATAIFVCRRPDEAVIYDDGCEIMPDGTISYALYPDEEEHNAVTDTAGVCECEIQLVDASTRVMTTARFTIIVDPVILSENDEENIRATPAYSELTTSISAARSALETAEGINTDYYGEGGIRSDVEDALEDMSTALSDAETATQGAERVNISMTRNADGIEVTTTDRDGTELVEQIWDGDDGAAGFSPAVSIVPGDGFTTVEITDKLHPHGQEFIVFDGQKGDKGDKGDPGEFTPTDTQLAAINSGISSDDVSLIRTAIQPSDLSDYYTKAETDSAIASAIGNAIGGAY